MEISCKFTDLIAWQKAHVFVLEVYKVTEKFPKHELFGLVSQFRRAAVSIPANIAEGYKRKGKAEKLRFFNISQGSLEECRYFIILSKDLSYIDEMEYNLLTHEIEESSRILNSYCLKISKDIQAN
ncbi:MAG: four helix bundle protein [Paludibacteraceae bacterium]|nr:four helix bundle protein [Paludibacteraceae bacterium]